MAAAAQRPARTSATQTFGALQIDRRVLTTPSRTIAIGNIATVSVGTHVEHRPRFLLWVAALVLVALAFGASQIGISASGKLNPVSVVLGLLAGAVAIYTLKPDDKTHYLLVSSSDGVLTRFTGPDRAVLDEVRRILTDKINTGDEASTFNVNFENGIIESLQVPRPTNSGPTPYVNGAGATPGANGATAAVAGRKIAPAQSGPAGRSGPTEQSFAATQSLATQLGRAIAPNGAAHNLGEIYVDFSALLPAVVEMHRFYARQANAQHLEQRLSELELLMRAGAQTSGQKSRVRELTQDLCTILQAYQPAVQIFQQIAGMAA